MLNVYRTVVGWGKVSIEKEDRGGVARASRPWIMGKITSEHGRDGHATVADVMLNVYRTIGVWGKVSIEKGDRDGTGETVYAAASTPARHLRIPWR